MMKAWRKIKLSDACVFNASSYSLKEKWKFVNYLDTGNITDNRIDFIQYIDVENDKLPGRARRKVKRNSIIYSTVRPNQRHFGIIKTQPDNFLVSTGFAVIDVDVDTLDADFLYYLLMQPALIETFHAIAEQSTSAYPSIKSSDIKDLEIEIPELATQKKIVEILGNLDRKITQNTEVNKNLEVQAQALYREMFVNTTNEQRRTCRAEEYFDIAIGKTPPRKERQWFTTNPSDVIWISISDMGSCGTYISRSSEQLTQEAIDKFNIKVVPSNTVLLSFKLTVGRIAITHGEMTTNEAIAHFKTDKSFINEYLYCYLKDFNYQTMGSTSSIAIAVNSKIIKAMPFVIPADDEISRFHSVAGPMFEQILNNQLENDSLAEIRDALLPRLMSGELDVSSLDI